MGGRAGLRPALEGVKASACTPSTMKKLLILALLTLTSGCTVDDYTLFVGNKTGSALTFMEVVTDPPPPHREPTRQLGHDKEAELGLPAFNPLFWDPVSKLGFAVQLAVGPDDVFTDVLVLVFQYQVQPGMEGSDPALQPVLQDQYHYEVDPDPKLLGVRVVAGLVSAGMPISFVQTQLPN